MVENQLGKLFEKYPHLRKETGEVIDIILEDELNGHEAAGKKFMQYTRLQ
jgi:hypothetical protein